MAIEEAVASIVDYTDYVDVPPNTQFTVSCTVRNIGDVGDYFDIELIDDSGHVQDAKEVYIEAGEEATVELTGTSNAIEGKFTWKIKATPESYPDNYDEKNITLNVANPRNYEASISVSDTTRVYSESPRTYEVKISITEKVDIASESPRTYEASISITEKVSVISQPPISYEAKISVSESVDVISQPPITYETMIDVSETVDVISQPPVTYEARIDVSENVYTISQPPITYETKIEITEVLDIKAIPPRTLEVSLSISERVAHNFRNYSVKISIIEKLKIEITIPFHVIIRAQDTIFIIIKGIIKHSVDELEKIIEKMEYKKFGDIIEPDDFNLIVKALRKQTEINEALL